MNPTPIPPALHFGWTLETGKRYPYRGFAIQRNNPQIFQADVLQHMIQIKQEMLQSTSPRPGQGDSRDEVVFRLNMLGEPYPNAHVIELQKFQGEKLVQTWTSLQALNPKRPRQREALIQAGKQALDVASKAFQKRFPTPAEASTECDPPTTHPTAPSVARRQRRFWFLG